MLAAALDLFSQKGYHYTLSPASGGEGEGKGAF